MQKGIAPLIKTSTNLTKIHGDYYENFTYQWCKLKYAWY